MATPQGQTGAWPALNMEPQPHQQQFADTVAQQGIKAKGLLGYHSLGSGKTFSSILTAQKLGRPIVAVVPAALRENYKKELESSGFKGDATVVSYDEARELQNDPEFLEKSKESVVVFDEAHRMGVEGSKTSKVSRLPAFKKLLMTGSPIRNHPSELAPLLNAIKPGALPNTPQEFMAKFVKDVKVNPGLMGRFKGVKPGYFKKLTNEAELMKAFEGVVDHYQASLEHFPSHSEEHVHVDMSPRQQAVYDAIMRKNPGLAYKLRHGIPPDKSELHKYKQFLVGLRQAGNTPREFASKFDRGDDAKIQRMADEVVKMRALTPNYRGMAYSNYIKSGVHALHEELTRRGIKSEIFSGALKDEQKKELVNKYNSGELPMILLSGAGAEGISLKGTKHVMIAEPHWNSGRIDQVIGRARRYKSHAHLPEEERHVHVQHFFAKYPRSPFQAVLGVKEHKSADETLHTLSYQKRQLNDQFLNVLKKSSKPVSPDALNASALAAKNQDAMRGDPQAHRRAMTQHAVQKGQRIEQALSPKAPNGK